MVNVEVAGKADQILDDRPEVGVGRQRGMQRELLAGPLCDHARSGGIRELIVASLAGHDPLVEILRPEDHLHQLANAAAPLQPDAEFLADRAGAAVATGQVGTAQRLLVSINRSRDDGDAGHVLREIDQFTTVSDGDVRRSFRHFLQQRLKLVLRNELIRFQQPLAVRRCGDLLPALGHRGIFQHRERRIAQPRRQKHIHRIVGRIAQRAHPIDDPDPAVELHGPGVGPVHLRIGQRRRAALDDQAPDAAPAKIDG